MPVPVDDVTQQLAALRRDLGAAACSVALVDGTELVFVAADGEGAEQVVGRRIPLDRGIAGWTVVSGQPIAIADVDRHARFDRATAESTGYVPTSILAVPLETDDTPIGVLEVLDRRPTADDLERASAVALAVVSAVTEHRDLDGSGARLDALLARLTRADPATRARAAGLLTQLLDGESVVEDELDR